MYQHLLRWVLAQCANTSWERCWRVLTALGISVGAVRSNSVPTLERQPCRGSDGRAVMSDERHDNQRKKEPLSRRARAPALIYIPIRRIENASPRPSSTLAVLHTTSLAPFVLAWDGMADGALRPAQTSGAQILPTALI